MTTSVLSNSLQEEDNTLQNNLNTNDKSNLEIKGDISRPGRFDRGNLVVEIAMIGSTFRA